MLIGMVVLLPSLVYLRFVLTCRVAFLCVPPKTLRCYERLFLLSCP